MLLDGDDDAVSVMTRLISARSFAFFDIDVDAFDHVGMATLPEIMGTSMLFF
jgi:hypothetical protein